MCTPSRTTLFTGLYPAQHRNFDTLSEHKSQSELEQQLDPTLPNIATVMKAAGYDLVWKGKWHLSKGLAYEDGSASSDDIARYGMNQWNGPDAGGDAKLYNYAGGTVDNDGRFFDGTTWQPMQSGDIFSQGDGPVNPEYEQASVMAFLKDRIQNPNPRPFCLIICLINPHDVLGYPGVSVSSGGNGTYTEGGYDSTWINPTWPTPIQNPPTANENLLVNLKPVCQPFFVQSSNFAFGAVNSDQLKQNYRNFYANLIKLVDMHLVKMLDLLDGLDNSVNAANATALRDNSWIIFSSDHGEMCMSHQGARQKSFLCYEEVARVPLVWSNSVDFASGSKVCNQLVSHVDFMPTLCSMVGVNPSQYKFKGVDYSSLIKNPNGPAVQNSILFTFDDIYSGQDALGQTNGLAPAPNRLRALVEQDYKYVYYFDAQGVKTPQDEFYDLRTKANNGTDTDYNPALQVPDSYNPTGLPTEYTNYSIWAENQRIVKKADRTIIANRTRMMADLKAALASKLAPLPPRPAVPPQDFGVTIMNYTNDYGQKQSDLNITWLSRSTTDYQLQMSRDQVTWTNVGSPVPGTNGPMLLTQPVTDFQAFYRLAWSPNSSSNNAPEPNNKNSYHNNQILYGGPYGVNAPGVPSSVDAAGE
jgi:hypothetical protein